MDLKIAVLPGDGIGPEIIEQAIKAIDATCKKYGHTVGYTYGSVGATAIDKTGNPYPEETHRICMQSDAVLFGAIGDPRFDNNPQAKVRPEQGLLEMRKKLGLYANLRPVSTFKSLVHRSPLRQELVSGNSPAAFISGSPRDVRKTGKPLSTVVYTPKPKSNGFAD